MNDLSPISPLEYATPSLEPFSAIKAKRVKWAAAVAPAVGLLILFAYACSGWEHLVIAGILWIYIGGGLAFVLGVTALLLYVLCRRDPELNRAAKREYGLAVVLCLLSVPIAIACVVAGIALVQYWHPSFD